ncbi:hypothetical protein EVAR_101488_1 [Eumeta japonica]|uniref:Uncharacterized protein n=1 Tax=Eumeta variegata TaxID=151549 RepID=A0A4C1T560_EUMVA|nr:hypothetical protein EVAR_101488_1 [Eumeta japonica]
MSYRPLLRYIMRHASCRGVYTYLPHAARRWRSINLFILETLTRAVNHAQLDLPIALKFSATATLPRRSEHLSVNIYRRGSSSISFRAAIAAIDQAPRGCGSIDCLPGSRGFRVYA